MDAWGIILDSHFCLQHLVLERQHAIAILTITVGSGLGDAASNRLPLPMVMVRMAIACHHYKTQML